MHVTLHVLSSMHAVNNFMQYKYCLLAFGENIYFQVECTQAKSLSNYRIWEKGPETLTRSVLH